jgi:restriction endonuclease S subunit
MPLGVTIPSISKSVVPEIELPIPVVEIQNEAVSLDKKIKDLQDYFSSQN